MSIEKLYHDYVKSGHLILAEKLHELFKKKIKVKEKTYQENIYDEDYGDQLDLEFIHLTQEEEEREEELLPEIYEE